jgi:hypothetical protein
VSRNYLHLTGGLGNQLFQWSALLATGSDKSFVIDISNGEPRKAPNGKPDLLAFNLPANAETIERKMPVLTRKSVGFTLRSHIDPKSWEKLPTLLLAVRIITSILISAHFRKLVIVRVALGLGHDTNFKVGRGNNFLIGYFQSAIWAQSIYSNHLLSLKLVEDTEQVRRYRELSKFEQPLVVHVRLGDYLSEGSLGIPSENYYHDAIYKQIASGIYKKIWLFSDEPKNALDMLPKNLPLDIRVIEHSGVTSAETLEIMRLGYGYVIANSTFSWWGAYLSYFKNPKVIFPIPWFRFLQDPAGLTPTEWEGMNAQY